MQYTDEQQAIIDCAAAGRPLRAIAYAGTVKTTTLRGVAEALAGQGKRVLYLAFNRATAKEAETKFQRTAEARTAHSLAFSGERRWIQGRELVGSTWRMRPWIDRLVDLDAAVDVSGKSREVAVSAVLATLGRFLNSDDDQVSPRHVPGILLASLTNEALDDAGLATWRSDWARALADAAQEAWDLINARPGLAITHDCYLKRFQLSRPTLAYDAILFDEAQDASPVMSALVAGQTAAQVIPVGDPYQQIYSWRGAINALDRFEGPALPLSQSWRFGPEVAAWANRILVGGFGADPPLTGLGPPGRVFAPGDLAEPPRPPYAVLCRGNAGVVQQVLEHLDGRLRVAVVGGTDEVVRLLAAAYDLYQGNETQHPDLQAFENWSQLVEASTTELGATYQPIVRLITEYRSTVPQLCARLQREVVPEDAAYVVISTAHKAKGREWPWVVLHSDFRAFAGEPEDNPGHYWALPEEARLQYVAITRATHVLDLSACTDLPASVAALSAWRRQEAETVALETAQ